MLSWHPPPPTFLDLPFQNTPNTSTSSAQPPIPFPTFPNKGWCKGGMRWQPYPGLGIFPISTSSVLGSTKIKIKMFFNVYVNAFFIFMVFHKKKIVDSIKTILKYIKLLHIFPSSHNAVIIYGIPPPSAAGAPHSFLMSKLVIYMFFLVQWVTSVKHFREDKIDR